MNMRYDLIIESAKEVALSQGTLPQSPFLENSAGGLVLCAAACIAYAGHKHTLGPEAADAMLEKLRTSPLNVYSLESAFEEVGLSKALCRKIRAENDSLPENDRLSWFMADAATFRIGHRAEH